MASKSVLLRPSAAVIVEEIVRFSAEESFRTGAIMGTRMLESIGWNFAQYLLHAVEISIPLSNLQAWNLAYSAADAWILDEIRKESVKTTPLAHVHHLLQLGENGPCHVDGQSNFTYSASPADGRFWGVHWFVNNGGAWVVGATLVPHPLIEWRAGSRLLVSRPNPDLARVK